MNLKTHQRKLEERAALLMLLALLALVLAGERRGFCGGHVPMQWSYGSALTRMVTDVTPPACHA
jgi:hypothetical protein